MIDRCAPEPVNSLAELLLERTEPSLCGHPRWVGGGASPPRGLVEGTSGSLDLLSKSCNPGIGSGGVFEDPRIRQVRLRVLEEEDSKLGIGTLNLGPFQGDLGFEQLQLTTRVFST
jgi:hypothetical protein